MNEREQLVAKALQEEYIQDALNVSELRIEICNTEYPYQEEITDLNIVLPVEGLIQIAKDKLYAFENDTDSTYYEDLHSDDYSMVKYAEDRMSALQEYIKKWDTVHKTVHRIQTGRETKISISERTYTKYDVPEFMRREEKIKIHDGYQWSIGTIHNEEQLKEVLQFLEIELGDVDREVELTTTGKITHYNLSKNINNPSGGGFWTMEQLKEMSNGLKLKKFKGLSNGSIVDCYVGIGENIVEIFRPNPNAKEVYQTMPLEEELKYKKENWYL